VIEVNSDADGISIVDGPDAVFVDWEDVEKLITDLELVFELETAGT
jgi:hypothetical protein